MTRSRHRGVLLALGVSAGALATWSMDAPRAESQAAPPAATATAPTDDLAASSNAPGEGHSEHDDGDGDGDNREDGAVADPALAGVAPPLIGPLREAWLAARIDAVLASRTRLGGARIGVAVVDPVSERILYQRDGQGHYNLASATKLITTAAGLALLGPEFCWRTGVYATAVDSAGVVKGDLYIRGRGDPTLSAIDLRSMVDELVGSGITGVRGRLVLDTTYFDDRDEPPHYDEQPKERAAFRAPVGALSVAFNAAAAVVVPARDGVSAATVTLDPPGTYVRLHASVQTVRSGRTRLHVDLGHGRDHLELSVRGQIRADAEVKRLRVRVDDPAASFAAAFTALLEARGVRFGHRTVAFAAVPEAARPLLVHESEPLAVVLRGLGKYSNNYVAESLLKTIGAEVKLQRLTAAAAATPGATLTSPQVAASWSDGLTAVAHFLVEEAGLAEGSFRYENGSGLFASTDISPLALAAVLTAAHRDFRWGADLIASLAIAGRDGTLRGRMVGTAAERRVRAKTGTLDAVSALAGYAGIDGRHPLAFAILINGVPSGAIGDARVAIDAVAASLVEFLDDTTAP